MRLPLKAFAVTAIVMAISSLSFALNFENSVKPEIKNQMIADLTFIGGVQGNGASKLHSSIYGQVNGGAYSHFFESRIRTVGMSDCGSKFAVACVNPMNPSRMMLTANFVNFSHPQIARMMVVFHEARHSESQNGNWMHATCPTPFKDPKGNDMKSIWTGAMLEGQPACDITPLGSYGSSTIMLKNIQAFCANCTDKVRMDAGLYADDQFKRIIDEDARQAMIADIMHAIERYRH